MILPYPPALNALYRMGRGNWYMQKEGKQYKQDVFFLVKMLRLPYLPIKGRIGMEVVAYPPDKRRRDIDGILKVLLDSLTLAQLYEDDNQIKRLLVEMMPYSVDKPNGELQLLVTGFDSLNGASR